MGAGVIIELPWPAREVWPNYRQSHHWSSFTKARKQQRADAHKTVLWTTGSVALDERIPLQVHFYPPDRRKRDDDGCVGAFKSARDGIADALGIDDRRFKPTYWFHEPVKGGKVVVEIGEPT